VPAVIAASGFVPPSITDFFPPAVLFEGTPFELNRIMLIRLLGVAVLLLLVGLGVRRMKLVPGRGQVMTEFALGFVRNNIIIETLGEKDGRRFMPILMSFFFLIVTLNLTGVVPGLQIAGTSVIGQALILAIIAWVMFIYAGMKKAPVGYWKNSLFIPGVPWVLYILLTPLEFFSTFILRPITLTLRLLMNMVSGHLLIILCWSATQFFFFTLLGSGNLLGLLGVGTFVFGTAWLAFEIFVALLQAYVFTFLAAIYIQLALADEH